MSLARLPFPAHPARFAVRKPAKCRLQQPLRHFFERLDRSTWPHFALQATFASTGPSEASFGQALTEAKAITLKSNVKKRARVGGELGTRNKMPFYFTVLRDILGMKRHSPPPGEG